MLFRNLAVITTLFLTASGGAQADDSWSCSASDRECYISAKTGQPGRWVFKTGPAEMSGTQPLPDTCFYTDLTFQDDGSLSHPVIGADPDDRTVKEWRRVQRNADGCLRATSDDCTSDGIPSDPLVWTAGFDRQYNQVRLSVKKCQMTRSIFPLFQKQPDGRITLLFGFSIDATGDSQLVEYEWSATP